MLVFLAPVSDNCEPTELNEFLIREPLLGDIKLGCCSLCPQCKPNDYIEIKTSIQ
jgi:hypothetical protein